MKSETRRRTVLVGVRFTPEEHASMKAYAAERHLSLPELMRTGVSFMQLMDAIDQSARQEFAR